MTGNMGNGAGDWYTLDDARTILDCSERTIRRRVAAGQLRARTGEGGRREVWIDTPRATGRDRSDMTGDDRTDDRQGAIVVATVGMAERGIMRAEAEAQRARRSSRAWMAVAASLAAGVGVAGPLVAGRIAATETRLEGLQVEVADTMADMADTMAERDRAMTDAAEQRGRADELAGRLDAALDVVHAANARADDLADELDTLRAWSIVAPPVVTVDERAPR